MAEYVKQLNQCTKTSLYENHIMMYDLCNLLNLSPNDIKNLAHNNSDRLLEEDVLQIISTHTKLSISELLN